MNRFIRVLTTTYFAHNFPSGFDWLLKKTTQRSLLGIAYLRCPQQTKEQRSKKFFNDLLEKLSIIIILVTMTSCLVSCNNSDKASLNYDTTNIERNLPDIIDKNNVDSDIEYVENLNDIIEKGFEIIPEQTFWVELDNYGKVKLVSGTRMSNYPLLNLNFYLVDLEDNILYKFPNFFANMWIFYEIKEIAFQDINSDGKIDMIVTAYYMVGAGEKAGIPFSAATIFFQNDMEFITLPEFDSDMHELEQNENIEMVLKYAENHKEDIVREINKINTGESIISR